MRMERSQIEGIERAMREIYHVVDKLEESGKNERVRRELIKVIGELYEIMRQ
ncbi:MAG: hypothetical protein IJM76_05785 [Lachnospiraceae bacterium]|nr:hypothetical protein [Lachnospiraceae bacterium]